MQNTLSDWLSYLESLHPKTIDLGLARVAAVRQRLGLEPGFPVIVVGGTNGKGSVCAMLEAILDAAGYKVGCYTSPHILHYNERVRIGKQQATDAELCASFAAIEQARKGQPTGGTEGSLTPTISRGEREQSSEAHDIPLTYFEFGTLAAMQCFIAHRVDVAILEVGLGGRLDAVNVFDADCAVVTSVDIDHTDYLGDTREVIAYEKAGIFRAGKVAVFGDADMPERIAAEARRIGAELWRQGGEFGFSLPSPAGGRGIEGEGAGDAAYPVSIVKSLARTSDETTSRLLKNVMSEAETREKGARKRSLHRVNEHFEPLFDAVSASAIVLQQPVSRSTRPASGQVAGYLPPAGEGLPKGQWNYRGPRGERHALPIPALRGAFQLNNASAVLAALDALSERLPVDMTAVRQGLAGVQLAGRFQFVPGRPQLILDVAHNPHAARSLAQNLSDLPPAKTYAVFAMLKDKDMAGVVEALAPHIDCWLVAGIDAPRGATADELAAVLRRAGVRGTVATFADTGEALLHACNVAGENDRIAAFGSFYTVAQAMAARDVVV